MNLQETEGLISKFNLLKERINKDKAKRVDFEKASGNLRADVEKNQTDDRLFIAEIDANLQKVRTKLIEIGDQAWISLDRETSI